MLVLVSCFSTNIQLDLLAFYHWVSLINNFFAKHLQLLFFVVMQFRKILLIIVWWEKCWGSSPFFLLLIFDSVQYKSGSLLEHSLSCIAFFIVFFDRILMQKFETLSSYNLAQMTAPLLWLDLRKLDQLKRGGKLGRLRVWITTTISGHRFLCKVLYWHIENVLLLLPLTATLSDANFLHSSRLCVISCPYWTLPPDRGWLRWVKIDWRWEIFFGQETTAISYDHHWVLCGLGFVHSWAAAFELTRQDVIDKGAFGYLFSFRSGRWFVVSLLLIFDVSLETQYWIWLLIIFVLLLVILYLNLFRCHHVLNLKNRIQL